MSTAPQKVKKLTLVLVIDGDRVLLGMKKRGFGAGRWNGFGGKVEKGETAVEAAARELREEAGIEAVRHDDLEQMGTLYFTTQGDPTALAVTVFRLRAFAGEPCETEEMRPQWFAFDRIPYGQMWPDDKHWLPTLLGGGRFMAEFEFAGENTIVGCAIMRWDPMRSLCWEPEGWHGKFMLAEQPQAARRA